MSSLIYEIYQVSKTDNLVQGAQKMLESFKKTAEEVRGANTEAKELAVKAKLAKLAKIAADKITRAERQHDARAKMLLAAEKGFQIRAQEDVDLWHTFLPTSYKNVESKSKLDMTFANYDFSAGVPTDIQDLIIETSEIFDVLEIRTPEEEMSDPALFGIIDDGTEKFTYLLARWGESLFSLDKLATVVKIKSDVEKSWFRPPQDEHEFFMYLSISVFAGFLPGAALETWPLWLAVSIAVCGALITIFSLRIRDLIKYLKHKKMGREHPDLIAFIVL